MASNNKGQLLNSESDEELDSYTDVATRTKQKHRVPIEAHVQVSNDHVVSYQDDMQAEDRDLGNGSFQASPRPPTTPFQQGGSRPKTQSTCSSARESTMDYDSEEEVSNFKREALFWLRHPRIKENYKTVTAAFLLFFAGIAFAITGIALVSSGESDNTKSIIFFVCAAICILPGAYHIIYIYRATKGQKGYNFESIPSFQ